MKRLLIACLLGAVVGLGLVGAARAAIDTYEFKDEVERERFRSLTEELRCPKCQNQDIADSNDGLSYLLKVRLATDFGRLRDVRVIVSPVQADIDSLAVTTNP